MSTIKIDYTEYNKLIKLAYQDTMTGLSNRIKFMETLTSRSRKDGDFTVLFMDLNGFKQANDRYGHDIGDEILKASGERLNRLTGNDDLVARFGGDEFVMLIDTSNLKKALKTIDTIYQNFAGQMKIDESLYNIGISVGYALSSEADDIHGMLKLADQRMYSEKNRIKGKNKPLFGILKKLSIKDLVFQVS